jgi:signal transduction histidine kinase
VSQFVVTPAGFAETPDSSILEYLRGAFIQQSKPDLVVTVGGPAAAFARRYRAELFLDTPFLFAAVEQRFLGAAALSDSEAAVAVTIDYTAMVSEILELLPRTKTVLVVTGTGPLSQFWRPELERNFQRLGRTLTFIWTDTLTYSEVLQRATALPPDSAIVYFAGGTFARGDWRSEEQAFKDLSEKGAAPLFGIQSVWLGMGIVGGTLLFTADLGAMAADAAARILDGESPASIRLAPEGQGPPVFDARQLRRWSISESRLPPGSEVRFRGPSLWRDYRREVLIAIGALALQSVLIAGLVYQRQARRRAETQSRTNLALAADADRRATVSAMSGSIAHELSQPLNAIQHNAQAGEMLIGSSRATLEELKDIFSDIRTANVRASDIVERHRTMLKNHTVVLQPIDLRSVIRESVAFVHHELQEAQVEIDIKTPPAACTVRGDQVLLQQVLVNVIMNAVDAMASTPPGKRRIMVRYDVRPEAVALSVCDTGSGLPQTLTNQVFEPFVTTKSKGLGIGLTIARSIVDWHRGTIEARDNVDGGATFTVKLPRERMSGAGEPVHVTGAA